MPGTFGDQAKEYLKQLLSAVVNPFRTVDAFTTGTSGASNQTSSSISAPGYKWVSLQFVATTLDASDGIIKLQDSDDGVNFNDISGASITVTSGTTSNMIRYTAFTGSYIRAVWTKGSNSTGTVRSIFVFKR